MSGICGCLRNVFANWTTSEAAPSKVAKVETKVEEKTQKAAVDVLHQVGGKQEIVVPLVVKKVEVVQTTRTEEPRQVVVSGVEETKASVCRSGMLLKEVLQEECNALILFVNELLANFQEIKGQYEESSVQKPSERTSSTLKIFEEKIKEVQKLLKNLYSIHNQSDSKNVGGIYELELDFRRCKIDHEDLSNYWEKFCKPYFKKQN
jgi:hypothetical protein